MSDVDACPRDKRIEKVNASGSVTIVRRGARAAAVNSGRQHALKHSRGRCRLRRSAQAFQRGSAAFTCTEAVPRSLKFVSDESLIASTAAANSCYLQL